MVLTRVSQIRDDRGDLSGSPTDEGVAEHEEFEEMAVGAIGERLDNHNLRLDLAGYVGTHLVTFEPSQLRFTEGQSELGCK